MITYTQLLKYPRIGKFRRTRCFDFQGAPHRRALIMRLDIQKPKKPNSARRRVAKVIIPAVDKWTFCYTPGESPLLNRFNRVLLRGGRRRDLPGSKYSAIRGVFEFRPVPNRRSSRSKYGLKKY